VDEPTVGKKRRTWKDRKCCCGGAVHSRFKLDAAWCGHVKCWDAIFSSLGYVPGKALLRRRATRRRHRG
jgi:hypothetical protein